MASILVGGIVIDVRGSVGPVTYTRSLAGLVAKSRSNPFQPESELKDAVQAIFLEVIGKWSGTLTEAQRNTWRLYGAKHPRPNKFGKRLIDGGYIHFCRCNFAAASLTTPLFFPSAPCDPPRPIPSVSVTATRTEGVSSLTTTLAGFYPLTAGDALIVQVGKSTNSGVNYFSGPWQRAKDFVWNGATWSPSLVAFPLQVWVGALAKLWVRAYIFNVATGARSTYTGASCIIEDL